MNTPTVDWKHLVGKKWYRILLHLLIAVVALRAAIPPSAKLAAAAPLLDQSVCSLSSGCPTALPPPDLLYLNQGGIYTSTPAQYASLKALESKAIKDVIGVHSLSPDDADAVKSWARSDAQAELYALLVEALGASTSERTADQQNAVDWIIAVAQRQNIKAAEAAGREYVKWAGLNMSRYNQLLSNSATSESDLTTFLSANPETVAWCSYRSPTPYADDYKGYNATTCFNPQPDPFAFPPTPKYDDFVKWGEASATYYLWSSPSFTEVAGNVATGLSVGLPLAAAAFAGIAIAPSAATASAAVTLLGTTFLSEFLTATAIGTVAIGAAAVTIVLIALAVAIIQGINVSDADKLPGKLAKLITEAKTTPPTTAQIIDSTDSSAFSLFGLFIGAMIPAPENRTCDNAASNQLPPGIYPLVNGSTGAITVLGSAPCLNATEIPAASATDPKFLVKAQGSTTSTIAPSISWKDTSTGTISTARLHENWFITQANGATAQKLSIAYTDWDGKEQNAWLIGNSTDGYLFLSYSPPADSSTSVNASTCVDDGYCTYGTSLKYVGADGKRYSASVQPYIAPTGTATFSTAVEASLVTFNANTFAPGGARGALTYQWRFQKAGCGLISCMKTTVITGTAEPGMPPPQPIITTGPDYSDPVSGATASYTWQTGGTYQVELKATDSVGQEATTTFPVKVATVPPTLKLYPACPVASGSCNQLSGETGTALTLGGTVDHTGTLDNEVVRVNWGDGSAEDIVGGGPNSLTLPGNPLLMIASGALSFIVSDAHTYANPGTYYGTVSVADWNGGTSSQTFSIKIMSKQTIHFPSISGHTYGQVFPISATGGASGQPVTFSTTQSCTLSDVTSGPGTGSATVTVISAGACTITASQAGTDTYNPAPNVAWKFTTLLALLNVTASSPTITYGDATPAITPSYSGFALADTIGTLLSPATCAAASNTGAAGSYATSCSGATASNYSIHYLPGTLTINKAPLTVTANNKSMIYGTTPPSFDAQISGFVKGEDSSAISGVTCSAKDSSGNPVSSTTPVDTYPIICSGGSAANYSFNYVAGMLTIDSARTTTVVTLSSPNAVYGQPVIATMKVSVNSPSSGVPTGRLTFTASGAAIPGCTAIPLDIATGTATCPINTFFIGSMGINANYGGDNNFIASSMQIPAFLRVDKASTTTTLNASTNPSIAGQPATFAATVAVAAPGAGTPTGSVTFKEGATTLGTGSLSTSNGTTVASFTMSGLSLGQHTITASYSGDAHFLDGTSATFTQYANTNLSGYPKLPSGAYNLSNKNLVGGYFVNVALAGANMSSSNFTSAVFLGANLNGANLSNSNFKGANFAGANLTGANLTGATLKGATGLKTATLTNITWNNTTCPDSTISNANAGTCVGHL